MTEKKKITKVSKAQKSKKKQEEQAVIDDDRMENIPSTVTTSIGEFELKELPFFPFIRLARKQIEIFWGVLSQIDFAEGSEMDSEKILSIMASISIIDNFEENMCEIIAAYCQDPDEDKFMSLSTKDMQIMIPAIVNKIDKEALKDFFSKTLPGMATNLKSQIQSSTE